MDGTNDAVEAYLAGLGQGDDPLRLSWEQWLEIGPLREDTAVEIREVTARYARNGYDWDIHGRLYAPEQAVQGAPAFVFFHGGADSEMVFDLTPDGRPGQARVLAAQGYSVLTISYPGHYAPGNHWAVPIAARQPLYLLDRDLDEDEVLDRNLKCTFNVILEGAAALVADNLPGRDIIAWGHSTGGPMAVALQRFVRANRVVGLAGFGSGGPDGWRKAWRETTGAERFVQLPVDHVSRRSPDTYRASGYEDPEDLCPWGGPEELFAWAEDGHRSQIKTSLCDNQHRGIAEILPEYAGRTGLPESEFLDHLADPDPDWLKSIAVLLLVGDNDKGHWVAGEALADKREMYMARRYRAQGVKRCRVVLIPRYGHFGFMELHNEKFVYLWLWALERGYFS
ncbi:MAG: alpha/beta fold hydrolase [Alphaproteobacteria bacterium]|nr:alpha/beta fold hydrolase [Alphaproteobacteria bacterium]